MSGEPSPPSSESQRPSVGRRPFKRWGTRIRRTILVGDVHGCIDELLRLLSACGYQRGDDLVLVGDLVAKGPDSQAVVQAARELKARAVRGNHDHHVLSWRRRGDDRPLKQHHQQVADALQPDDWSYLEDLPLWMRLPRHRALVVHAGFVPGVELRDQRPDFMLNLRSITPEGLPSKRADDGVPWASRWGGPELVIFGHDAARGLQQHRFATGLDTGCVYGNTLTALLLPERRLISVPARRAYCEPRSDR